MAFKAKDGKHFGSRQRQRAYDECKGSGSTEQETMNSTKPPAEEGEGQVTEGDIHQAVAEHGPAEHAEVISHHGGHKHKSHLMSSPDEVHQHIKAAFGHEEPDGDEAVSAMHSGQEMGIPGM